MPAGLRTLDDECVGAERGRLLGFGDAADLHPDLDSGLLQSFDMRRRRQRPEEDDERRTSGGLMSDPIVPSPPASQTAAARAGRAIIAMPALTMGVVSLKVRVIDVENIIWIPREHGG